ncbi:FAD-dependent monooxygenase OpS4 [Fusarium oxysporum f. sp. albedinis]|nr:FAD-dependent monooxygenase OpS4 [Fusarium oxysporum f. sp. albedinis]
MHQLNTVPMPPQRQGQRTISYKDMVLEAHEAPVIKCAIAALSNWMFLAGFVVFPGTFTSLGRATLLGESQAGRAVQQVIRNTPLLVIGILCCLAGGTGIGWTAWSFRNNYVWLVDRILM